MAGKASRLKYKQEKIGKAEKKLKDSWNEQLKINTREINELKTKVDILKKVNEQLDEVRSFLFDADANPPPPKASYFIAKVTALKHKRNEDKDDTKLQEEAI